MELQRALSSWLWERHVFEPRANETVVMLAASSHGTRRRRLRLAAATAAVLGSAGLLAYAVQHPIEVADWSDALTARLVSSD